MTDRRWTVPILGLGLSVSLVALWHLLVLGPVSDPLHLITDLVLIGGAAIALLYGWYWHVRNPLPADRYPRILAWIVTGSILLVGVGVIVLYIGSWTVEVQELIEAVHLMGATGLVAGLLFGTVEAERVETARAITEAETRAEALRAENERMDRLNDLMRHYLLNSVNVITGNASMLRSEVPPSEVEKLDRIQHNAETIATLGEHVRSLAQVERGELPSTRTTFESILSEAIARTSWTADQTITRAECSDIGQVPDSLSRVFDLLLDVLMAITDSNGTLEVACSQTESEVTVTLTTTPAALPPAIVQSLFEPISTGVGLELYLAHGLMDPYGDIELTTNDDETVAFELSFDSRGAQSVSE